jgi:hypothetical protein
MSFDQAVADFPMRQINRLPPNVSYTPWHLLEHIRIAQWDILEFTQDPDHVSPRWPEGYWPPPDEQANEVKWEKTISDIRTDLRALQNMVEDSSTDLYAPLGHAKDYTVLREVLLVADHNAYHIGEFTVLRQVMDSWSV